MGVTWVLGAQSQEMSAVEALLRAAQHEVRYAEYLGRRVYSDVAYRATGPLIEGPVITVECAGAWETVGHCDHRRHGDRGFGEPPEEYRAASSLGQVWCRLNQGVNLPSQLQRVAAADHCLMAAYSGACPGVDPAALQGWREQSRAKYLGVFVQDVRSAVARATAELLETRRIWLSHSGALVTDFRHHPVRWEHKEAAARGRISFLAGPTELPDGRERFSCFGEASKVAAFFRWAKARRLVDAYGDPARGYTGAYTGYPSMLRPRANNWSWEEWECVPEGSLTLGCSGRKYRMVTGVECRHTIRYSYDLEVQLLRTLGMNRSTSRVLRHKDRKSRVLAIESTLRVEPEVLARAGKIGWVQDLVAWSTVPGL